jgi:DUF438 domain-containing protein
MPNGFTRDNVKKNVVYSVTEQKGIVGLALYYTVLWPGLCKYVRQCLKTFHYLAKVSNFGKFFVKFDQKLSEKMEMLIFLALQTN